MKRIFKVSIISAISVVSVICCLVIFDLHFLRGYFLIPIVYPDTFKNFNGNIKYYINNNHDGTFDFSLKNEDFAYYPIILYRDEPFFDLNDSVLFPYASCFTISGSGIDLFDTGSGIDCGTGLTYALIRPYESFELKRVTLETFLKRSDLSYVADSIKRWNIPNDSIRNLKWKFYLPIFSFGEESTRVYSNKILTGSLIVKD